MRYLKFSVLAGLFAMAAVASAKVQYFTNYNLTFPGNNPSFDITNIMIGEQVPGVFSSDTWAFQTSSPDGGEIDNPFPSDTPIQQSILIGIAHDLPGDAAGQKHIVLCMDDTAASLSENIDWDTLFRNTDEDQLISDLELATSGQDWPVIQPGLDAVNNFFFGDATDGILDGLAQSHSAWFTTGGDFTIETWSNGQTIGEGTSTIVSQTVPDPVPEPASMAALGLGFAALLRRRKKA